MNGALMPFGEITEYQRTLTTECKWEDCKETPLLYGGATVFPDGSTYCKGECTRRRRAFLAELAKGSRSMWARKRK